METKDIRDYTADEMWENEHGDTPSVEELLEDAVERAGGLPRTRIAKVDDPQKRKER